MKKNTIIDNYMFGVMKYKRNKGERYYRSRSMSRKYGFNLTKSEEQEDSYHDLAREISSYVRGRYNTSSSIMQYLKKERVNVPLSIVKKIAKEYKDRLLKIDPIFGNSEEKESLYEQMVNSIKIHMRDYRIDQVNP